MMKNVKFVDQGACRYVDGNVKPFDEKNMMFRRPLWDPELEELKEKFYFTPNKPQEKPMDLDAYI